jgi:alpha-glucan,water dikinase
MIERIIAVSGIALTAEKALKDDGSIEVIIHKEGNRQCLLHWGLRRSNQSDWQIPPRSTWPPGTQAYNETALQTPFLNQNGRDLIAIQLDRTMEFASLDFALFFPKHNYWDNNNGRNYQLFIPKSGEPPQTIHLNWQDQVLKKDQVRYENVYSIDQGHQLYVAVAYDQHQYRILLSTDIPGSLALHWGVTRRSRHEWDLPPTAMFPPGTIVVQATAAQTPFVGNASANRLILEIGDSEAPSGMVFVLNQLDSGRWLKNRGSNFYVPILGTLDPVASLEDAQLAPLADEIIEREMSHNSWTLMHRFNLCYDLLDKVRGNSEGLALIYVWLRFSAMRQLDWQRNYNTKPRELSHALDRLTLKLADRYVQEPQEREWIRLIMTTLGRGSNGQEVRDEILRIMHRHHIKEVSGHFLEEWHQKLHNNTTPDDVVICEAYIRFLKSNGDLDDFYRTLEAAGVGRERLQSFERPINSHPDFVPHLKDALIRDFEHFLGILKAVHSGTDLGTAIHSARYLFDGELHGLADFVWRHRDDRSIPPSQMLGRVASWRSRLKDMIEARTGARDLLFLDLALEQFCRILVERNLDCLLNGDELVGLISEVLENLRLSRSNEELNRCGTHWQRLQTAPRSDREWPVQAMAVLDRLVRVLGDTIDRYHKILQSKALYLGEAFHAAAWTVNLFSEEVIRGQLEFALSAILRLLSPILRKMAHLGNWQVISPGFAAGYVELTTHLRSLQGKGFSRPTIIVAEKVSGDEDIPEGAVALITPGATDIVSHVAVRARNAGLLFADCYHSETLSHLKSFEGQSLSLKVTFSGDVVFDVSPHGIEPPRIPSFPVQPRVSLPGFKAYAIAAEDFDDRQVGGKSNNIKKLLGKLPKWVNLPRSVAMPFGVFEKVLAEEPNREVFERYEELASNVDDVPEDQRLARLLELQTTIMGLKAPQHLPTLLQTVMEQSGLPWPHSWDDAWTCIKRVWASKWNDRAYLSRRAMGIPHGDLFMAVLIQDVVEADYSFVIHTVNPVSGNRDEIFAEVVLGLGEALVGNYPGRALGFTSRKGVHDPFITAFPSKSLGVYGSGLIFRSDSNGEDLTGFAGAGLYDSFLLPPPQKTPLDYANEPLCWNDHFRTNLLVNIAVIGTTVERVLDCPQDIEGAYSGGQYFVVQTRPQVGLRED